MKLTEEQWMILASYFEPRFPGIKGISQSTLPEMIDRLRMGLGDLTEKIKFLDNEKAVIQFLLDTWEGK